MTSHPTTTPTATSEDIPNYFYHYTYRDSMCTKEVPSYKKQLCTIGQDTRVPIRCHKVKVTTITTTVPVDCTQQECSTFHCTIYSHKYKSKQKLDFNSTSSSHPYHKPPLSTPRKGALCFFFFFFLYLYIHFFNCTAFW